VRLPDGGHAACVDPLTFQAVLPAIEVERPVLISIVQHPMMKAPKTASVAILVALLALPSIARAEKTSFHFDRTADFSRFRTYAWKQIDLVDASKRELVWRGIGLDEIDIEAEPGKRDAAIGKTIEKILKNDPPKSR
jgi:hypothetical protein